MHSTLMKFLAVLIFIAFSAPCQGAAPEVPAQAPAAPDTPRIMPDRTTQVSVEVVGSDSLGARFSTRLKERFNQSSLFRLRMDNDKSAPELRLLINTASEFPSRPSVGSVYGVCWVFRENKDYLGFLLAREVGTVNADDMDALVDKLVERTDGIAAKYNYLWNK